MRVAVLLLTLSDNPRRTTFTRAWAKRCVGVAGEYYAAQSAGQAVITWQVFDWLTLDMDEKQWSALSSTGIDDLVTFVTPMLPAGTNLKGDFDHILVGIDSLNSSGGTTPGAFTYLGAVNFTPSFIGHEFGHHFGASDAFGTAAAGRRRYEHPYCVMGAMGWPETFDDPRLVADEAPGLAGTGPCMSAPTLLATGWLDPTQHNVVTDLSGSVEVRHGAMVALSALAGSPGVGWTRPPVAVRFGDYLVEYRVAAAWDGGIPVASGAEGKVVVNSSPPSAPVAELVGAVDALPGAVLTVGGSDVLDLGSPGPLVIRVLSVDTANDIVHLSLTQHAARGGLEGMGVGPGWGGDGGGWVWTPGRGLQRIPPYSPLHDALTSLGDLAALHELAERAPRAQVEMVRERAAATLVELQESMTRVTAEPTASPVQQALSALDALEESRRRFEADVHRGELGQEYLEAGQATIERLTVLLQTAEREERQL